MSVVSSQKVISNSVALVLMAVLAKGARLVSFLVIVRYLSQEAFGQFALIIAVTELFRVVGDFGIDVTITKWFSDKTKSHREVIETASVAKLIATTTAIVMVIGCSLAIGYSGNVLFGIIIASLGYYFGILSNLFKATYQAALSMPKLVVPSFLVSLLYLALVTIASFVGLNVVLLVGLGVAVDGLFFIYLLLDARHRGMLVSASASVKSLREMFRSSSAVGVLSIVVVAYTRLSAIIVAQLGGEVAIAHYTSAYRITEAVLILTGSFASSMLPVLSQHIHSYGNLDSAQNLFFSYLKKMLFVSTFAAVLLTLFSRQIITLAFTERYVDAAPALAVLSWSIVFASSNMFLSNVLYAADLQRYVLIVSIANLVLNCGVNFALIPIWSYYGAAVATTVTECLNSVLQYAAVLFLFKLFRYEKRIAFVLIRAWLWIFCLGILLLVFPNGTTLSLSILLTGIYLLQLTLSKDVSVQDIRRLFRQPVPSETS